MSGTEQPDEAGAPSTENKTSNSTHSEPAAPKATDVTTAVPEQHKSPNQQTPSASANDSLERPSTGEQQADRPSVRRERKQTAFFQPDTKVETVKLEIKEVSIETLHCCCDLRSELKQAVSLSYRDKAPSLAISQTVSVTTIAPCSKLMHHAATTCAMLQLLFT